MPGEDWAERLARETTNQIMGDLTAKAAAMVDRGGGTLAELFLLERKSALKKFCKQTAILKEEFSLTIIACDMGLLPWGHEIYHRQFVPEHLQPTDEEMGEIASVAAGDSLPKALKKMVASFDERRMLVGHIFFNPEDISRWHLLYFDQRDADSHRNHWEAGSHVHLINWLIWGDMNANEAWQKFRDGNPTLRGGLHIKCAFERE